MVIGNFTTKTSVFKAGTTGSIPWGVIHWALWMRAQHSFKSIQIQPGKGVLNNKTKLPPGGTVSSFTGGWLVLLDVLLNI